jgi:tRNA (guanine26-N2/guanine27-N2)-dimethyltransferase
VVKGAKAADRCLEKMGYVEHCPGCGSFILLERPAPGGICRHCLGKTALAGPLWLGAIHEPQVIMKALACRKLSTRAERLLMACAQEIDVPMYYDHHSICERLHITPGRIEGVLERLRQGGRQASRTHFWGLAIKTDACMAEVEAAIRPE